MSVSQQPSGSAPQQPAVSSSSTGQNFVNVDVCLKTGEVIETQRVGISGWTSAKELAFEVVKRLGRRHKFIQEESQQTGGLAVLDVTVGEANAAIWAQDRLMDVMDIRQERARVILDREKFEGSKRKVFVMQAAPTAGVPQPSAPAAAPVVQPDPVPNATASGAAQSPSENAPGPTQCSTLLDRQETKETKPVLQRGVSSIISNAVRNHNNNGSSHNSSNNTNATAAMAVPQHRPKAPSRRAASKKPAESEEGRNARKSKNAERKDTKSADVEVEDESVKPLTPKREGWGAKAAKFFSPSSYCTDPDEILRKRRRLEAEKKKLAKAAASNNSNNEKEDVAPSAALVKKDKKQVKIKTEQEADEIPAPAMEVSPSDEQVAQPPGFGTKGTDFFSPNYVSDPDALRRLMRKKQQEEGGNGQETVEAAAEESDKRPAQPPGFGTKGTDYFSPNFVSDPDALRRQKKKEEAEKKKHQQLKEEQQQPLEEEGKSAPAAKTNQGRRSAVANVVAPTATRTAAAKPNTTAVPSSSGAGKTNPSTIPPGKNAATGTPAFTKEGVNRALFTPDGVEIMSALDAELAGENVDEEVLAARLSGKQEVARSTTPESDRHFTNAFKNSVAKGVNPPDNKQAIAAASVNKGELAGGSKSQQYFSSNYVSDPGKMTKEQATKLLAQDNKSPFTRSRTSNLRFRSNFLSPEESAMALQQSKKNKSWMM